MDGSELLFTFTVYLGMTQIFTDFPREVNKYGKKTHAIRLLPVGQICEYLSHPQMFCKN